LFVSRRSDVLSFRVCLSVTWCKLWSAIIYKLIKKKKTNTTGRKTKILQYIKNWNIQYKKNNAKLTGNILRTSYLTYPLKTPINTSTRIINQKSFLATSKALERTKDGILYTDTVEKTNILNQQFQSVFTHDPPHDIPDKGPSPHPIKEQIHINDKGVLNLLNNLKGPTIWLEGGGVMVFWFVQKNVFVWKITILYQKSYFFQF
jgi:hypothetical protein